MRPSALAALALAAAALAPAPAPAAGPAARLVGKRVAQEREPGERFGSAVAADGAAAVVGSPLRNSNLASQTGRVHGLAGADWADVTDIDSSFGAISSRELGTSAAIDGELAVFGAPLYLVNNLYYAGGVYVYAAAGPGMWALDSLLPAPTPVADKYVGLDVGLAQGRVIAGSLLDTPGATGRAYAWTRLGPGMWSPPQTLEAPDPAGDDRFGLAVSVRGDRALIGAPGKDSARGAAYVFQWTGAEWVDAGRLVAVERQPNERFGTSVAIDGDVAVVGAPGRDADSGAAFVFEKRGDLWIERAALVPADREPASLHGWTVALRGPHAVVAALDHGLDPNTPDLGGSGRAVWYGRLTDGAWTQLATIAAEDGIPGDRLGWSVALEDGAALVGAPGDDESLGAVYVFRLELPDGAACAAATDCESGACCDDVCAPACGPSTTTDAATDTGSTDPTEGTAATSDTPSPPALDLEPAADPGCACASQPVPGDSILAALALLALGRTPRRRRSAVAHAARPSPACHRSHR